MEKVMKKFRLKCCLIDKATKRSAGLRIVDIYGYNGNEAVGAYVNQLRAEGEYELDDNYSYSELGPVSSN